MKNPFRSERFAVTPYADRSISEWRISCLRQFAVRPVAVLAQLRVMKFREVITMLEKDGWRLFVQEGSHRQYKHPVKRGKVTVAGKPGNDVPKGTLNSILRQAGLK